MTGEKDRFKSLEKLGRFEDESLKTPEHDMMVQTLLGPQFCMNLIPKIKQAIGDYQTVYIGSVLHEYWKEHNERMWDKLKKGDDLTELEEADMIKTASITDLQNTFPWANRLDLPNLFPAIWSEHLKAYRQALLSVPTALQIKSEVPITTGRDFIIGYWDVVITLKRVIKSNEFFELIFKQDVPTFYIEVKPRVFSFGGVLRQLNTYRHFIKGDYEVYLYTKDHQFDSAFESQGIKMIHPPEPDGGG